MRVLGLSFFYAE